MFFIASSTTSSADDSSGTVSVFGIGHDETAQPTKESVPVFAPFIDDLPLKYDEAQSLLSTKILLKALNFPTGNLRATVEKNRFVMVVPAYTGGICRIRQVHLTNGNSLMSKAEEQSVLVTVTVQVGTGVISRQTELNLAFVTVRFNEQHSIWVPDKVHKCF